ncbi:MAG: hypothetical protein WAN50_02765 [Minisyncoccia bacterium]
MSTSAVHEKNVNITLSKKEEAKARLKKLQEEEVQTVKGRFIFHECPGGSVRVCMKKFKDVPLFDITMQDGKEYEVPLYVARHLNGYDKGAIAVNGIINSCAYPVHQYAQDAQGISRIDIGQWRRRFSFQSLEFIS